jgi:hypothetical protein
MDNEKMVELVARSLDDLLAGPWGIYKHLFRPTRYPANPQHKKCIQTYITIYLWRRVDEDTINRIVYDQVLHALITKDPKDHQITAWDHKPQLLSREFMSLGEKYRTNWEQVYKFLLGKTWQWWSHIDKDWMQNSVKNAIKPEKHRQRQRDRENWWRVGKNTFIRRQDGIMRPFFDHNLHYKILTYL